MHLLSNNHVAVPKKLEYNADTNVIDRTIGPTIPYFRNVRFVRVCSLVCRHFYNMYSVKKFEIVFSFNVKDSDLSIRMRMST